MTYFVACDNSTPAYVRLRTRSRRRLRYLLQLDICVESHMERMVDKQIHKHIAK